MPKKIERKIVREYRRKGFSLKRSRSIAYATMQKRGLLHRRGGKRQNRK